MAEKQAGLSDIAAVCGVTPQAIYDWVRRAKRAPKRFHVPARHIPALCKAYGVTPETLLN